MSKANLALLEQIDRLLTKCPFYVSRQMVQALAREGFNTDHWLNFEYKTGKFPPRKNSS